MAAPAGNEFWKLRAKHGRDLIFSDPKTGEGSPALLWEAANDYFETTAQRTWDKEDWVGKDAYPVVRKTSAPFTLTGLYIFLDIDHSTWDLYRKRKDFIDVIARIEQIIFTQKFEGAAVGAYNANIIARDLGLSDKQENTVKNEIPLFPDVSKDNSYKQTT